MLSPLIQSAIKKGWVSFRTQPQKPKHDHAKFIKELREYLKSRGLTCRGGEPKYKQRRLPRYEYHKKYMQLIRSKIPIQFGSEMDSWFEMKVRQHD